MPNEPADQVILDCEAIQAILPHRPPALLISKIIATEAGPRAVFWTDATADYFKGHFPGNPVVPLHTTQEAMAQGGAVLAILQKAEWRDKNIELFATRYKTRAHDFVGPDCQVEIELVSFKIKTLDGQTTAMADVIASVCGNLVAEVTVMATVVVSEMSCVVVPIDEPLSVPV